MSTHRDEKGRISPAQSKVAKRAGHTLGGLAESHGNLPASHDKGATVGGRKMYGLSGMAAQAKANETHPHVTKAWSEHRQKLKVIARGKQDSYKKAYTKVGKEFHVKGLLKSPGTRDDTAVEHIRKASAIQARIPDVWKKKSKAPQESAMAKLKHRGGE